MKKISGAETLDCDLHRCRSETVPARSLLHQSLRDQRVRTRAASCLLLAMVLVIVVVEGAVGI